MYRVSLQIRLQQEVACRLENKSSQVNSALLEDWGYICQLSGRVSAGETGSQNIFNKWLPAAKRKAQFPPSQLPHSSLTAPSLLLHSSLTPPSLTPPSLLPHSFTPPSLLPLSSPPSEADDLIRSHIIMILSSLSSSCSRLSCFVSFLLFNMRQSDVTTVYYYYF